MPEFNRKYTYGIGRFTYTVTFLMGMIHIICDQTGDISGQKACKYHLTEVTQQEGFRYLD